MRSFDTLDNWHEEFLKQQIPRNALRAAYCSQIILSPFNHERSELEASVIEFVNKMLNKSGN